MVDRAAQDERRVAYWDDESHHPDHRDIFIVSGEGCWITDKSGRRLLDAASGHSCVNLGYANEELIEVAAQSYRRLAYCSPEHRCQSVAALSARLSDRLGGDYRLRYATTGGGANELAIEIARRHWLHVGRAQEEKHHRSGSELSRVNRHGELRKRPQHSAVASHGPQPGISTCGRCARSNPREIARLSLPSSGL